MTRCRFIKEGRNWYIDLPEFIANDGSKQDLQMVEGADTMLDYIAGTKDEVSLLFARSLFYGADKLTLTKRCDPIVGGGYYALGEFRDSIKICGCAQSQNMCSVISQSRPL